MSRHHSSRTSRTAHLEALEPRRLLSFSAAVNYPIDASADAIATADFNNDGKFDLVTCADAGPGSFSVLLGNGAGGFGAAQRYVVGSLLSSIAVADFNNDTRPDMVVSDNGGFSILIGNGDGTFQSAVHTWGAGEMATVGDFDNDSNIDVVVIWTDPDWATHTRVYVSVRRIHTCHRKHGRPRRRIRGICRVLRFTAL
jgi:FG-GAP-like repeat